MDVSHPERILDLLIALGNAPVRMTKQDIRRQVAGYGDDDAAFERMFERDKSLLRSIGVPLVVDRGLVHEDDVGYRIDLDAYSMDLSLSPEEIGVLSLARELHHNAQWQEAARRGVTKVRAFGDAERAEISAIALELTSPEDSVDVLCEAIARRMRVNFTYTGLSSPTRARQVEPWRMVAQKKGWYLVGRDCDSGEQRRFRLNRITSDVRVVGQAGAFEIPPHELEQSQEIEVAIAVRTGRATSLRVRGMTEPFDAERDLVRLTVDDQASFAREVAGFGSDAIVVEPQSLRDEVIRALRIAAEVADYA